MVLAYAALTGIVVLTVSLTRADSGQPGEIHRSDGTSLWTSLITQASKLGLPIRFLRVVPPDFIVVEFADLRAFAAEYHPETHLMILNRALSFNAAGGVLKPLAGMNHRDVATIYHELFHAYLDYVRTSPVHAVMDADARRLLAFAKDRQDCRYTLVHITPLRQKKTVTEPRFLNEHESWEALNETWAVFVGWAIWTRLETTGSKKSVQAKLLKSLKKADQSGELVGYYEPEDSKEREVTNKRYLAHKSRITRSEVTLLLEVVLEESPDAASRLAAAMTPDPAPDPGVPSCGGSKALRP